MALPDLSKATRRWLKVGLTVAGIVAGALFGVVLTVLGKLIADAPPATLGNYVWNAAVFGLFAGVISPTVTWSSLRRVPLWRTIVEPLAFAVAGGVAALVAGSGVLLLTLPPIGLGLGFGWLSRRYPQEPIVAQRQLGRSALLPANDEVSSPR